MIVHSDKFLSDIQKRLSDLLILSPQEKRQLYLAQAEVLEGSISKQFKSIGSRFLGHAWAPLAESTERAYKRKGYSLKPTLNRTGGSGLFGSIQTTIGNDGPIVGSNKEYATYLQFGTRHMSPRPFLPMPPFQRRLLEDDIERIRNATIQLYNLKVKKLK